MPMRQRYRIQQPQPSPCRHMRRESPCHYPSPQPRHKHSQAHPDREHTNHLADTHGSC